MASHKNSFVAGIPVPAQISTITDDTGKLSPVNL
jgi:hypothetical protein